MNTLGLFTRSWSSCLLQGRDVLWVFFPDVADDDVVTLSLEVLLAHGAATFSLRTPVCGHRQRYILVAGVAEVADVGLPKPLASLTHLHDNVC